MITIEAKTLEEALDLIDIEEAIIEAAKHCNKFIYIEYGINKPYKDLFGEEDYEWVQYGEDYISIDDIGIGLDEVLCTLGAKL